MFEVKIMDGTLVHVARENLVKYALGNAFTHTLWLDSDMVFDGGLLDDLLFSGKDDFVSGIYHARRPPHGSCIFKNIDPENIERYETNYPRDTFEIGGCGFGCVLVSTKIIRDVVDKFGMAFLPMAKLGEDLAFCQRVHDCGYKMYCEPGVRLGHIGHITIYPDDRLYWSMLGGMANGVN